MSRTGWRLTVSTGTWTSPDTLKYGYVWKHCDAAHDPCTAIPGAMNVSYTPVAGDLTDTIEVQVTATDQESQATAAISSAVGPITS